MPHQLSQGGLWDPLNAWPAGRRWLWAALAILVGTIQGPTFIRTLWPAPGFGNDFFQEWSSARNLLNGLAVYTDIEVTARLYAGFERQLGDENFIEKNAHPPGSVLLGLPFALLDYPNATFAWNLVSLGALAVSLVLISRELGIRLSGWSLFPVVTLLLVCNPFRQQMLQGQLNLVLLAMITGTWVAAKSGRPWWAGALLGAATSIKLFPGFIFLYFVLRRQWKVVGAGALAFGAITALTVALMGVRTYRDYVTEVLPYVSKFRSDWPNVSLVGLWTKLFDIGAVHLGYRVSPIIHSPVLARAGIMLSCATVLVLWARVVLRSRTQNEYDHAFGLTLTTMLLISPISWDHYFLLLMLPLAQLWVALRPADSLKGLAFLGLLLTLWVEPMPIWSYFLPEFVERGASVYAPLPSLLVLSFLNYVLIVIFIMGVVTHGDELPNARGSGGSESAE